MNKMLIGQAYYPVYFITIIFTIVLSGCSSKEKIAGYIVSDFPNLCKEEPKPYTGLTTISDPKEYFQVSLPYKWDIQELFNDSIYGIIGANLEESDMDIRLLESFSVNGYRSDDSLSGYFNKEMEELKKNSLIRIQTLGKIEFASRDARWVLFESEEKAGIFINLVVYVKKDKSDEIFLLQSTVYKTDDYKEKLCRIKSLFDTFEFQQVD